MTRSPSRFLRAATQLSTFVPELGTGGAFDDARTQVTATFDSLLSPPPAAPPPLVVVPTIPVAAPIAGAGGQILLVFGCRGGAGCTGLSVNIANQLVRSGRTVCVVDFDFQLGDVFVALDIEPTTSIAALAREVSTIDDAALRRRLVRHDSGIYALTQTGRIQDIDPGMVERIPALLARLSESFDHVIVDGIRDFDDAALGALDMADRVALVLTQDVASVRRAARVISLFRQLGYDHGKLTIVLNRVVRGSRIGDGEIAKALAHAVDAQVRDDIKPMRRAFDEGALLADIAPSSRAAKDVAALAAVLTTAPGGEPARRRSLFGWLRRSTTLVTVPAPKGSR